MFKLRLLGGLSLESNSDGQLRRATQKRRLALLAVLAIRPGAVITRDKLLALFWPEVASDEARHRLSAALYDLRQALGDESIVSRGDEIWLTPTALECDVVEFEAAVERRDWQLASQVYRGPFLDGVHIEDAAEFDQWAEQRRAQLARGFSRSLEELARDCTTKGDHAAAVEAWQRLADSDPLNDRFALGLMKASRGGRQPRRRAPVRHGA